MAPIDSGGSIDDATEREGTVAERVRQLQRDQHAASSRSIASAVVRWQRVVELLKGTPISVSERQCAGGRLRDHRAAGVAAWPADPGGV